jgi:sugar phosphate permease
MRFSLRIKSVHWAWYILAASFLTAVVSYSIRLGYGVILPHMLESFRISKTEGGLIYSVFFFMYTLFAPIVGNLTDRLGARRVITLFCAIMAIGVLLMGTVQSLEGAMLFMAIAGVGISATWAPVVALCTGWFGPNRRGSVLGTITGGVHLGYGVLGVVFPLLVARYSWRLGWVLLGLSAVLVAVMNGLVLRSRPEDVGLQSLGGQTKTIETSIQGKRNYQEVFKKKKFWLIGTSYFFIAFCYYTLISFMVTYGTTELGIHYGVASSFATVFAFAATAGAVSVGTFSDRFGRKRSIILSELLIAGSVFLMIAAGPSFWILFPAIGVCGLFSGPIFPLYGACSRDYFEQGVTGTVIGAWTCIYGVGATIAPLLAGYLADRTGTLRWGFALAGVAALVAPVLMVPVRKGQP